MNPQRAPSYQLAPFCRAIASRAKLSRFCSDERTEQTNKTPPSEQGGCRAGWVHRMPKSRVRSLNDHRMPKFHIAAARCREALARRCVSTLSVGVVHVRSFAPFLFRLELAESRPDSSQAGRDGCFLCHPLHLRPYSWNESLFRFVALRLNLCALRCRLGLGARLKSCAFRRRLRFGALSCLSLPFS